MTDLLETVGPRAGASPLTYTLTEAGTVDLQSAFAHFDGAAASGSFRPALTVRAQNGTVLARVFPSDTLAAGDSADVTFAPFLRQTGGGGGYDTIQDEGVALTQRSVLDFAGSGVTATDDAGNSRTLVTIPSGGGYDTIQDEGVALTQRSVIDFAGAGVTATDDAGNTRTLVTIPGGGSGTDITCRVSNSTNVTLTTTVRQALTFDTEVFDTDGMHSTTVNPERITINTTGKYLVGGEALFTANATGRRDLGVYVGSLSAFVVFFADTNAGAGINQGMACQTLIDLTAGDYIELRARQDSGGNLDVIAVGFYSPIFYAVKVG